MSEKILKQDIIDLLAEEKKISKRDAEMFIKAMFDLIEEALKTDQYIKIKGLGTFKLVKISRRESININTGERIFIEGHSRISFTPDITLRDSINKPFAHFETVVLNDDTVIDDIPVGDEEDTDEEFDNEFSLPETSEDQPEIKEVMQSDEPESSIVIENKPDETHEKQQKNTNKSFQENETTETKNQPNKAINIESTVMNQDEKQGLPYFIAIVAVIIILLSGLIIYIYNPRMLMNLLPESPKTETAIDSIPEKNEIKEPVVSIPVPSRDTIVVKDTVPSVVVQNTKIEKPVEKAIERPVEKIIEKPISKSSDMVSPNTEVKEQVNYRIVGTKTTYTLQPGETLIILSRRYYGTKDLWPYIAIHNRDIVKDPDHVPYGTTIKIPELKVE